MKKEIKYLIENSIKILNNKKNYNFEESDYKKIEITHPDIVKYGDFTCNISLPLSKKVSKKPRDLAMEIEDELENLLKKNENKGIAQNIEKIEIAGPGFLNFYLSKSFYKNILDEILEKEEK
jgi:arginyl-tRNA synthetase